MNPKLITFISHIPDWRANDGKNIIDTLKKMPGVLVSELKFSDLMLPDNQCNGVYVFQQGQNFQITENDKKGQPNIMKDSVFWYVGKAGGRALVDRIGAHFAPRHDDYMNVLLKNIAWLYSDFKTQKEFLASKDGKYKNACIEKAFNVIQDLYIKVIVFDIPNNQLNFKSDIAWAESKLKQGLCPLLNDVNRKSQKLILNP